MLTSTGTVAHAGAPLQPHDLPYAWNLDPLVVLAIVVPAVLYARGTRPSPQQRTHARLFSAGVLALVVALVSPLDALSGELASAHMVQHVLLTLVAAPLLALSAPAATMLRGAPAFVRHGVRRARRGAGLDAPGIRRLRNPMWRWLAFVTTLWLWHASALYGAALRHDAVHALEHASFFATALLVWSSLVGPARVRVPRGLAVLGVFTLALQSVFLAALLTFARTPWYEAYAASTATWGLEPLADQQLAGVLMWIPAGLLHAGIALALLTSWLREVERDASPV